MKMKSFLGPGIWADEDGLHFSIPDLLHHFGWPDDPPHRQEVQAMIREIVSKEYPNIPITEDD
jgi:hypothetical protein